MPRYIVKLAEDTYIEWSTVVDAPVSYVCDRAAAVTEWGEDRIARTDRNNHSLLDTERKTLDQLVGWNRAGDDESSISVEQIIDRYTYRPKE